MKDREISAGCAVAYGAWALSLIIWAVAWGIGSNELRALSLIVCGVAVTATVRTYFVGFTTTIRRAFDQEVTPMRR